MITIANIYNRFENLPNLSLVMIESTVLMSTSVWVCAFMYLIYREGGGRQGREGKARWNGKVSE